VGRARTGEAISADRRTPTARRTLIRFIEAAEKRGDLDCWRRGRAVLGYVDKRRVMDLAEEAGVTRGSVNRWLQWYEALGIDGLLTGRASGRGAEVDRAAALRTDDGGRGRTAGCRLSERRVDRADDRRPDRAALRRPLPQPPHPSVQRPRKRLARADALAQEHWLRVRLPAIKKKPQAAAAS
jgi:hypothetical protein